MTDQVDDILNQVDQQKTQGPNPQKKTFNAADSILDEVDAVHKPISNWDAYANSMQTASKPQIGLLARSALSGNTLGLSEPIISGTKAAYNSLISGQKFSDAYNQDVEQRKQDIAEHPGADIGGQVVGALTPTPWNVGSKIFEGARGLVGAGKAFLGPAVEAGADLAGPLAAKIPGLIPVANSAARVATSAAEGGLAGGGAAITQQAALRPTGFETNKSDPSDNVSNAADLGAKISGGLALVPEVGGALASGASKSMKYFAHFAMGAPNPEVIDKYIAHAAEINAAPTMEEMKDKVDKVVGALHQDVVNNELSTSKAQDAVNAFTEQLAEKYESAGKDQKEAVQMAKSAFSDAKDNQLIRASIDIQDSITSLKKQVIEGSQQSYQTLEDSGLSFDKSPIVKQIKNQIKALKIGGKSAISDAASGAISQLEAMQGRIGDLPKKISSSQVKEIVQQLDQDIDFLKNAGDFSGPANAAKTQIRRDLDQTIKGQIPEYADQMEGVSENAGLLNRLSSNFGTEQKAANKLKNISSPQYMEDRDALEKLKGITGKDYLGAVNEENLPEFKDLSRAQLAEKMLAQNKDASLNRGLLESPQYKDLVDSQNNLEASKAKLAPFQSLAPNAAGQTHSEEKIKRLMSGNNIEVTRMFKELAKMSDTDLVTTAQNMRLKQAMTGEGATQGSRKAIIWGAMMGALGFLGHGEVGGAMGAAAGSKFGGFLDKYGPKTTKYVIDKLAEIKGDPTMEKIMGLNLPDWVKKDLSARLSQAGVVASEPSK